MGSLQAKGVASSAAKSETHKLPLMVEESASRNLTGSRFQHDGAALVIPLTTLSCREKYDGCTSENAR